MWCCHLLIGYLVHYYQEVRLNLINVVKLIVFQTYNQSKFFLFISYMRRIVTKDKKGKKKLVNVPSWDEIYVNNQLGQPAYDVSISSNSGSLAN